MSLVKFVNNLSIQLTLIYSRSSLNLKSWSEILSSDVWSDDVRCCFSKRLIILSILRLSIFRVCSPIYESYKKSIMQINVMHPLQMINVKSCNKMSARLTKKFNLFISQLYFSFCSQTRLKFLMILQFFQLLFLSQPDLGGEILEGLKRIIKKES